MTSFSILIYQILYLKESLDIHQETITLRLQLYQES